MQTKRTVSILLLAALLATVSCGSSGTAESDGTTSGSESTTETTVETTAPDPLSSLRKEDFGGRTYTMLGTSDSSMSALAPNELNAPSSTETSSTIRYTTATVRSRICTTSRSSRRRSPAER